MITVSDSIDIQAPPERVWQVTTGLGRMAEWDPMVIEVMGTPPEAAKGARWKARIKWPLRVDTEDIEITEFDPPRRLALRGTGWASFSSSHTIEPAGAGSKLTTVFEVEPPGVLPKLGAPMAKRSFAKDMRKSLERRKRLAES